MSLFDKLGQSVKKLGVFGGVFSKIDDALYDQLEEELILSDVGMNTALKLVEQLRRRARERGAADIETLRLLLRELVGEMLTAPPAPQATQKPHILLVIGVNGVGKTTTIGKLSHMYRTQDKSVLLAAADTFRAAAVEQLEIWAQRSGAELVSHAQGSDPAAVVHDAISAAKARGTDVVICDTAGRLHNKKNLMDELAKIRRVIDRELPGSTPEVYLVVDATTGQNAVNQAREFGAAAGITGLVLTKLDGTAKGGVVLAIMNEVGIPVRYVGVGEHMDDLLPFDPAAFAEALF
jgi:fused signal recognition particle receptor